MTTGKAWKHPLNMAGYNDWKSSRLHTWPCFIQYIYERSRLCDKAQQPTDLCG